MIFLFQTTAVLKSDLPFKQRQKDISKFEWQSKKLRVKNKILQNAKDRGRLGLPYLKLYFAASCLVLIKSGRC